MPNSLKTLPASLLCALLPLVTGCASAPSLSPPLVIAPPSIPALPFQARQPPPQAICSPTCSGGLQTLLDSLLR